MNEPFKNQGTIYQALLDGKALRSDKVVVKLIDDVLCSKVINSNHGCFEHSYAYSFGSPDDWSIYEEPKWDDNIPKCGVLCWVSNSTSVKKTIRLIIAKTIDGYLSHGGGWDNAEPLTKEEVMQYIWNGNE